MVESYLRLRSGNSLQPVLVMQTECPTHQWFDERLSVDLTVTSLTFSSSSPGSHGHVEQRLLAPQGEGGVHDLLQRRVSCSLSPYLTDVILRAVTIRAFIPKYFGTGLTV